MTFGMDGAAVVFETVHEFLAPPIPEDPKRFVFFVVAAPKELPKPKVFY